MASSFEEIISEVMAIEKRTKELSGMLQRENEKMARTMGDVQETFGDQQTGQIIAQLLNNVMHKGITTDVAIVSIEGKLQRYSLNLQK